MRSKSRDPRTGDYYYITLCKECVQVPICIISRFPTLSVMMILIPIHLSVVKPSLGGWASNAGSNLAHSSSPLPCGLICDSADCTTKAGRRVAGIAKLKLIAACVRCWANYLLRTKAPGEHTNIEQICCLVASSYYINNHGDAANWAFKLVKFAW